MTYVRAMNSAIGAALNDTVIAFGQNISAGSHLAGLTQNLDVTSGCQMLNMPNVENSLVGFGFGLMLEGEHAVYFSKQQDFLLLTLDQIVNTANIVTANKPQGSFTIVFITVDSGYEGPQSRLNNIADISSLCGQPCYTVTTEVEADYIFGRHLTARGFRMIGVSQRLFSEPPPDPGPARPLDEEGSIFKYRDGKDITIIACNYSLPQAAMLAEELLDRGIRASLYSMPCVYPTEFRLLLDAANSSGRLVILDDSQSRLGCGEQVRRLVRRHASNIKTIVLSRSEETRNFKPNPDKFEVSLNTVREAFNF